jgi:hypothetical protein
MPRTQVQKKPFSGVFFFGVYFYFFPPFKFSDVAQFAIMLTKIQPNLGSALVCTSGDDQSDISSE